MNWILLVSIVILAGNIVWGLSKGFLRVAFSLVQWLLVFFILSKGAPVVATYIMENTSLPQKLIEQCEKQLEKSVTEMIDPNVGSNLVAEQGDLSEMGIRIPMILADSLLKKTGVYGRMAEGIAQMAVQGLSYIIVLLITVILLFLLNRALGIVDKIPVISGVNRLLGVAAGFLKGMIVIWLGFAIVAFCIGTSWSQFVISYIYEAPVLIWIYENNLLLSLFLRLL